MALNKKDFPAEEPKPSLLDEMDEERAARIPEPRSYITDILVVDEGKGVLEGELGWYETYEGEWIRVDGMDVHLPGIMDALDVASDATEDSYGMWETRYGRWRITIEKIGD